MSMFPGKLKPSAGIAVVGDLVVYLLVTLIGFASHDTLRASNLTRILATWIPFSVAWFMLAPWFGLFNVAVFQRREFLLRAVIAAMLAAPTGAFLRGLWLGTPILTTFVFIMAGVSAAIMFAWRLTFHLLFPRAQK